MQVKKDQVRESIEVAALKVFAKKGYIEAKIADIAAQASVSVGNIYRYFKTKDEIFYSVMPESFAPDMLRAAAVKIGSVRGGIPEPDGLQAATDEFIRFMLLNRERITILIAGSRGTRYETFRSELADALQAALQNLYPDHYKRYLEKYKNSSILHGIYENLISLYGDALAGNTPDDMAESRIRQVDAYHYAGITSLLELFL